MECIGAEVDGAQEDRIISRIEYVVVIAVARRAVVIIRILKGLDRDVSRIRSLE